MPRTLGGKRLRKDQVQALDKLAEKLTGKRGIKNPWAVAIASFKKGHVQTKTGWRKRKK